MPNLEKMLPLAAALCAALASTAGWAWSYESGTWARRESSTRIAALERELTETRGNLDECKAWMDSKLAAAEAFEPAVPAPAPAGSTAPAAIGPADAPTAAAVDTAAAAQPDPSPSSEEIQRRHALRRRRMLQSRGQLTGIETRDDDAGTP
jgi:hypothetical protein